MPPQKDEVRPQIYAGRKNKHGRSVEGPKLLFMVHIHTIFTEFTHFCREISLVAITRFGRHFLAKIWWEEAPKHFIGPGPSDPHFEKGGSPCKLGAVHFRFRQLRAQNYFR